MMTDKFDLVGVLLVVYKERREDANALKMIGIKGISKCRQNNEIPCEKAEHSSDLRGL